MGDIVTLRCGPVNGKGLPSQDKPGAHLNSQRLSPRAPAQGSEGARSCWCQPAGGPGQGCVLPQPRTPALELGNPSKELLEPW